MKVSSKQNTLMKWFSKSPKKDTPQKVQASDEDDGNDQRPKKKPKLESWQSHPTPALNNQTEFITHITSLLNMFRPTLHDQLYIHQSLFSAGESCEWSIRITKSINYELLMKFWNSIFF